MRDKVYLDELNRIGQQRALQDEINFTDESRRLILGNEMYQLVDELGWRKDFDVDTRAFNERINQMTQENAYDVAQAEAMAANQRQMWKGIGDLGAAGIDYQKSEEKGRS